MKFTRFFTLAFIALATFTSVTMLATSPQELFSAVYHASADETAEYDIELVDYDIKKLSEGKTESRYSLTINIKNLGESFENQQFAFSIRPYNKVLILAQKDGNFSLEKGKTHSVTQEILLPKHVNKQGFEIDIVALSLSESATDNNVQQFIIREDHGGLANINIRSLDDFGNVHLDWKKPSAEYATYKYSLLVFESDRSMGLKGPYAEAPASHYGYKVLPFTHSLLTRHAFQKEAFVNQSWNFGEDLYASDTYKLVIVEAYNAELERTSYSDALYLSPQSIITRAELAEIIVKDLNIELIPEVALFYEDVENGDQFKPYIQALFAGGYLEDVSHFGPYDVADRRYVADLMGRIFDLPVDVKISAFEDINENDSDFYLIKSIKSSVPALEGKRFFLPEEPSSLDFAESLIDVLSAKYDIS